jgi:cytochrome c
MRWIVAAAFLAAAGGVRAETCGAQVFEPCQACHALSKDAGQKPGPQLVGLIGRPVAGDPAFDYSPVLRKANNENLRWDAERLDHFLADPAEMFPGLWMSIRGVEDAADRAALVRFLSDPASR